MRLEEENRALHAQKEQLARDYALKQALKAAQVRSQKAVLALLDMPLIRLEEGKLTGLDEQLKRIKEECPYLFEAPRGQYPQFCTMSQSASASMADMAARRAMGL